MFLTYQITHKVSKKFYIGKTTKRRWAKGYMGSGIAIKQAVAKYGKKAFYRAVLSTFTVEADAYADEIMRVTMEEVDNPQCYNLIVGGSGFGAGEEHFNFGKTGDKSPNYGKTMSKEAREKLSAARKGMVFSDEHKANLSVARRTRITSDATKAKMSASQKGKTLAPETRIKLSITHAAKKKSPEHLAKISLLSAGKKHTPEMKRKRQKTLFERKLIRQQVAIEHAYPVATAGAV